MNKKAKLRKNSNANHLHSTNYKGQGIDVPDLTMLVWFITYYLKTRNYE